MFPKNSCKAMCRLVAKKLLNKLYTSVSSMHVLCSKLLDKFKVWNLLIKIIAMKVVMWLSLNMNEKQFTKIEQKVGMMLLKSTDTRGVRILHYEVKGISTTH